MPTSSGCPTPDQLRALLDGSLSDVEQTSLNRHLESCESCQRTLESLVAGKESWDGVARRLANADGPATPALADAMASAKQSADTISSGGGAPTDADLPLNFLQPSDQPDSLGRLGPYEILHVIGRGGFGVVLKALDTSLRRIVAIKVLSPALAANASARRRFVREARAAAAVVHEHVVAIHAVADQHEPPYLVMQYIEGKTLQDRLDQSGPLAVREVLRIGMQTAAGLAAAHAQGLVHRDIKPSNILLENGVERVKLTDFGLARAMDDASVTQSGVIAGTPQYMSPEQARGEAVDHRSDLFSLGCVLYSVCVGHAPFRASTTMGVLKRVCDDSPPPIHELNPDIPDWLIRLVGKLMAKNPADRFQTAKEAADVLGQSLVQLQQPQTIPLPIQAASLPQAASPGATPALPLVAQENLAIKVLTVPALGVFGLLVVIVLIGKMHWQEFLVASCVLGLWVMFVRWIVTARRALALAASQPDEIPKPEAMPPRSQSRSMRVRIGLALGLVAGSLSMAWLISTNLQPMSRPADGWWGFVGEFGLWLAAGACLVTGILVGGRRFVRGLDTTTPGGRLWGTAISGALLAIVCAGLLLVGGFAAVYQSSYSPRPMTTAHLTLKLAGPHIAVTLNGEKVAVPPSGQVDLSLVAGEYVIATIKNGRPEVRSGETLYAGEVKVSEYQESQADAIQITGPMVMSYGPGASAPSVADYIQLQGRWTIISEERGGELVTAPQRGKWIEFDRGTMRWDTPDTPRFQLFPTESRVAIYAAVHPGQIDILNFRASGIYKLDGDSLTLAIADPDKPRPTEFVSRPGSAVTLTICRRAEKSRRDSGSDNRAWSVAFGWSLGPDGPTLTDGFARDVLKLQPAQIEQVNRVLQAIYDEYPVLEAKNTEQQTNEAGHLVIRINTFTDQIEKLESRLWSQLDTILDPQQQSLARLNLKLGPSAGVSLNNLGEFARPGFFGWGKQGLYLELWRVGVWYHWKVQSGGAQDSSRAPQLPEGYRRFWKEPTQSVKDAPTTEELDRLVELAEQDLRRVRALVEKNVESTAAADEAEVKVIEARVRRANARQDHAEVVTQLRRLVEIRESEQARIGNLVKSGTVPPSESANAEKRLLEAKIQLKDAETALAMTLIPAQGIAWGPISPMGMQLGLQLDPRRDEYRRGETVKLQLFLRNAGKTAMSTTLPRLEVLEKFDFDLSLLDDQGRKLPWSWGQAHKSQALFTVSGGMALTLRPDAMHELPVVEIVIGKGTASATAMAHLDLELGQTCRLVGKLGTYGYAKGEGDPLESGVISVRVQPGGSDLSNVEQTKPAAELLFDKAGVWNVIRSHDGKLLVAIGPNGDRDGSKFKVWDAETLAERLTFTEGRTMFDLAFLPDGQRIATCESDFRIRLRDLATGGILQESEKFADSPLSLAVGDNGETLIFGGPDQLVRVWDLKANQIRSVFSGATTRIHSVAASPDGKFVAAGCENGHILVWDAKTAERRHLWTHFDRKVTSVAFSPDSKHLAAANWEHIACIFDPGNDFPWKFLTKHTNHVHAVAWSPDGQRVATASSDGTVMLWNAAKADRLIVINANANQCYDAVFLDNARLATTHRDGVVRVWDVSAFENGSSKPKQ